jgi:hypothetical protein
MTVPAQLLIAAALVAAPVILGTDVFAAIVLRAALACAGDRTLTGVSRSKRRAPAGMQVAAERCARNKTL